jgi:hypothetical protein
MCPTGPSEGESPRDPQAETVGAPHRDSDPPRRTRTAGLSTGLALGLWLALGLALVVLAIVAL